MGVFITIRILRKAGAAESHKKRALLGEFCMNLTDIEAIDRKNLQSGIKKATHYALNLLPEGYRKTIKKRTFERNLEVEKNDLPGDYYYYTNVRGMKPVRHEFKSNWWTDVQEIEMEGTRYRLPLAMTTRDVEHEANLSNAAPVDSIYIYRSDEMSWDEISPLIDDDAYMALDWDTFAKKEKYFRNIDKEVNRVWKMVLKLGEELESESTTKQGIET